MCDDQRLANAASKTMTFPKQVSLIPQSQPVHATVLGWRDGSLQKLVEILQKQFDSTLITFEAGGIYPDLDAQQVTVLSKESDVLIVGDHLQAWQFYPLFESIHCPLMMIDPPMVFHPYQASCRQMFRNNGLDVLPAENPTRINQSFIALRARKWLANSTVLWVTDPTDTHPMRGDVQARAAATHQLTGVKVICIPVGQLKLMASQVTRNQTQQVWAHWRETLFSDVDSNLTQEHLDDTARLYVAMRQLVDTHQANAIAVEDIGAFLFNNMAMPNLAHTALRAQGITTAEEGDLTMLITQLFFASINQQQAMMGNVYLGYRDAWESNKAHDAYGPDAIAADFNQCVSEKTALMCHFGTPGILPLCMTDEKRYRVVETKPSWRGQSMSLAIPKLGSSLLARLDETSNELHVYPGQITRTYDDPDGGWYRGRFLIHMPGIEHFVDHGFSAHYALGLRPDTASLASLCQLLKIECCIHE
ncbi:MAG TPA: hypothetical protein DCM28_12040 [Phycisphaerales bacterium]|nr:hypothetical protein [Phycisphaerales bacterium]HCD34920.1 hypothetical protein [Phycisphaerales bacterium]|tara:strand:- start:28698 stop:30125 length:1428 start_codon:yes stop_codon:yes gene_type:complete